MNLVAYSLIPTKSLCTKQQVRGRGLEDVVQSCEYLEDIVLVMQGFGELEPVLRQNGSKFKNCRFEQSIPSSQTIVAASNADVRIVSYFPVDMNNYLASIYR